MSTKQSNEMTSALKNALSDVITRLKSAGVNPTAVHYLLDSAPYIETNQTPDTTVYEPLAPNAPYLILSLPELVGMGGQAFIADVDLLVGKE
jgi:hypothetical protein